MDEQKQIILIATPVMSQERYAQLTGLTEGRVMVISGVWKQVEGVAYPVG